MENNFNISSPERNISAIEFPPLNEEDVKEIWNLYIKIYKFYEKIYNIEPYTGQESMGKEEDIYYNSELTLFQIGYALAMTRNQLLKKIEQSESNQKLDARELVENKIMAGMKILDLGCGPYPAFARFCRAMGADVWTVDKDNIRAISDYCKKVFTQEQLDFEKERHIQIDLNNKQAVDIIKEKSGGDFNLITEANLSADNFNRGESVAIPLLKKGGVYYDTATVNPKLKQ